MTKNTKQLQLQHHGHGGWRRGAGRRKSETAGVSHLKRVEVKAIYPMHLTVRLRAGVPSLRSKRSFAVFTKAVEGAKQKGLRVLQFAVLGNHFHLLAEAASNAELTRAMKCLNIRLAIGLNRLARQDSRLTEAEKRKGTVLKDRYDLKRLTTPTQVRNAMIYVLANASKHFKRKQVFDWFSSFSVFENVEALARLRIDLDWRRRSLTAPQRDFYQSLVGPPESWLARVGWLRATSCRDCMAHVGR